MGCEYAYLNANCAHASYACCDFSCLVGCSESEKKTTLDQALRSVLGDLIVSIMNYKGHVTVVVYSLDLFLYLQVEQKASCDDYLSLIDLSIDAVTEGLLSSELFLSLRGFYCEYASCSQ